MKQMLRVRAVEGRLVAREGTSPPEFLGATRAPAGSSAAWVFDTAAVHLVPSTHYYRHAVAVGDLTEAPADAAPSAAEGDDR